MTAAVIDPLTVSCPLCEAEPGQRCMAVCDWARKPHAVRKKLAVTLAADADPVLDEWFPKRGQCLVCETPGLDQRHRVVDAIADAVLAGEDEEDVATDYEYPVAAVLVAVEWKQRWS